MCTAPRAVPRLFYNQPRQLPCAWHLVLDQGFATARQGSCHVHGTPCWTKAFLQPVKAAAMCMAPRTGPRLFYSQPRQLPCARHPVLDQVFSTTSHDSCHVHGTLCSSHVHISCDVHSTMQGISTASQGSCHVYGTLCLTKAFLQPAKAAVMCTATPCWTKAFLQPAKAAAMCTA